MASQSHSLHCPMQATVALTPVTKQYNLVLHVGEKHCWRYKSNRRSDDAVVSHTLWLLALAAHYTTNGLEHLWQGDEQSTYVLTLPYNKRHNTLGGKVQKYWKNQSKLIVDEPGCEVGQSPRHEFGCEIGIRSSVSPIPRACSAVPECTSSSSSSPSV